MSAIKNKNTKIEVVFGKALWSKGVRYRKNDKSVFGSPDFSLKRFKIAIFCDSEFFHGKNWESRKSDIKSNIEFWHKKIEKNIRRDNIVNKTLSDQGWTVLRFWGNDIIKNVESCIEKVKIEIDNFN